MIESEKIVVSCPYKINVFLVVSPTPLSVTRTTWEITSNYTIVCMYISFNVFIMFNMYIATKSKK